MHVFRLIRVSERCKHLEVLGARPTGGKSKHSRAREQITKYVKSKYYLACQRVIGVLAARVGGKDNGM